MDEFELEDGDGFDEFDKAVSRQTIDEEFKAFDRKRIKKLADERWSDHLGDDQRDVIRKAKAGNPAAREQIHRAFNKACIRIAGSARYDGPSYDDRLAAAHEGLAKAIRGFDLNRNNGVYAYAVKFIEGAVVDCVHDWHQQGGKLETREERENRSNGHGFRPIFVHYNSIEKTHDEDGADADDNANGRQITGWTAPDEAEPIWDETRERLSRRLALIGRRLGVPRECIGVDENPIRNGGRYPKKIIGTPGFQIHRASSSYESRPTPKQYLTDPSRIRGNAPPLGIIGYLAKNAELRAKRRLAEVGRRRYAQELAIKDRTAIEPLFEATQANYCVPINTASTNTTNAKRRITALVVAVDNGVENGTIKYNDAVQLGGGVHRADRSNSHNVRKVS
jgi:hypothetical protein